MKRNIFTVGLFAAIIPFSSAVSTQQVLAEDALKDIIARGEPILGQDNGCSNASVTCNWMAKIPDETLLVHMNLPGTHDTATWNYSQATQDSLIRYTGSDIPEARVYRCQEHPLFDMLNGGVRVFDLRFSWNPGNDTVGLFHAEALLSPTTQIEDVFFGFYSWLDAHPTETLLISMKYEGGPGRQDSTQLQAHMYNLFESPLAKRYWVQDNAKLGTLGESRGKLVLLQRFAYNLLPTDLTNRIGIPLPPNLWTDNGDNIALVYNNEDNSTAFIEDYYEPQPPEDESPDNRAEINIQWKFNATTAHLTRAAANNTETKDQLFITFASASKNDEGVYPRNIALGNGTSTPGMNQRLLEWLKGREGRRGVVMLDFFDSVPGLVEAVIGL